MITLESMLLEAGTMNPQQKLIFMAD
jgi:hypothetical protein